MEVPGPPVPSKPGESSVKWQLCYDMTAKMWWMVSGPRPRAPGSSSRGRRGRGQGWGQQRAGGVGTSHLEVRPQLPWRLPARPGPTCVDVAGTPTVLGPQPGGSVAARSRGRAAPGRWTERQEDPVRGPCGPGPAPSHLCPATPESGGRPHCSRGWQGPGEAAGQGIARTWHPAGSSWGRPLALKLAPSQAEQEAVPGEPGLKGTWGISRPAGTLAPPSRVTRLVPVSGVREDRTCPRPGSAAPWFRLLFFVGDTTECPRPRSHAHPGHSRDRDR